MAGESMPLSRVLTSGSLEISQEGYDYDFTSATEKYECPICLMCIRDPHQTECGHRFCNNCIRRWLRDEERGKKCPSCNDLLSELQLYPDNFAKREILSMNVKCSFHRHGCSTIIELKKVEVHEANCDYAVVQCPEGCTASMLRKDVQHHLLEECSHRNIACPHCHLNLPAEAIEVHMAECDLAVASCEYCQLTLTRQQIARHMQTDCPKAAVKCLFHRFGCETVLPRSDISQHNVQQTQLHMRMLALTLEELLRAIPDLQQRGLNDRDALSSWSAGEAAFGVPASGDESCGVYVNLPLLMNATDSRSPIAAHAVHAVESSMAAALYATAARQTPGCAAAMTAEEGPHSLAGLPQQLQLYPLPATRHSTLKSLSSGLLDAFDAAGCSKATAVEGRDSGTAASGSLKDMCGGESMRAAEYSLQSEQHRIRELERESATQRQYVFELKAKLHAAERTVSAVQLQLAEVEGRVCGGTFIWKLHNYSKLRQDVSSGGGSVATGGVLHSPGFYTSFYGYKFCVRVNVNGVETAQGTHLALFIHLMQSENDDVLSWPFQGKITFSVLDQNDTPGVRNHITETLIAKPTLAAFQRPTAPRNHKGFGYMEFAPFNYLESSSYVKNDTLIIRAEVKPA